MSRATQQLHATTISLEGRAVVITGPSGAGKSALALQLMALGAGLVADDITLIDAGATGPVASCPETGRGRIEARGLGILNAGPADPAPVALVIDMGQVETDRLPPARHIHLAGYDVPLLHKVESSHFPAAIIQYIRHGRFA